MTSRTLHFGVFVLPLLAALGACSGRSGYVPTSTSPTDDNGGAADDDDDTTPVRPRGDAGDADATVDPDAGTSSSSSSSSSSSASSSSGAPDGGGGGVQTGIPDPSGT